VSISSHGECLAYVRLPVAVPGPWHPMRRQRVFGPKRKSKLADATSVLQPG
jgi:hypothetical protein